METNLVTTNIKQLEPMLNNMGWFIDFCDIDVSKQTIDLRLYQSDGLFLLVKVDHLQRCSIEQFLRNSQLMQSQVYGKKAPLCMNHDDAFLGRFKFENKEKMFTFLDQYLTKHSQLNVSSHSLPLMVFH